MKLILASAACFLFLGTAAGAAETLRIVTEPYPGYSAEKDGRIVGASADQVHAILTRAHIDYQMEIMPWARAYSLATHEKNICIFSTNHTTERHPLFQWIEPLGAGRVLLVRKAGSKIAPKTVEEAKNFTIGVQRGDYAADYLKKQGFTQLDYASDFGLTLKKLVSGRIDLAMTSEAAFRAEVDKGQPLEEVLAMPAAIYALACSLDVPASTVNALQNELESLITAGEQDAIYEKYGMPAQKLQNVLRKTN